MPNATTIRGLILGLALANCGGAKGPRGAGTAAKCDGEAQIYGVLAGGRPLCSGRRTVNVHVRGDLGAEAKFSVTGPNGYAVSGTAPVSGPCQYRFRWDFGEGLAAGEYTVVVTGAGKSVNSRAAVEACGGI